MFLQDPPRLENRLSADPSLRGALERLLGDDVWREVKGELERLGERAAGELPELQTEAEAHPPRHVPFDAWGRRVDRIEVSRAWQDLVRIGVEAGLVAHPYERPGPDGRVVQAALVQMFGPVSAMASCPLAMTDGAARVLVEHDPELAARYVPRLTRRDRGLTSGQWMTETAGGSDVSGAETVARPLGDGRWGLHGTKWFTSATTADIALVLARPEGAAAGSRGLSLFLLELRDPEGAWNRLTVRRLKDKLGTRALPTAELELEGSVAVPVGGLGRGVAKVASMLNVTRLWTAQGSVGPAGHLLALARDYAQRRRVFGAPLRDQPIHAAWMARLAARHEAATALAFEAARLVGQVEVGEGDPRLARIVTPLAKLACSRQSVDLASELLESFGGAGYLEDTGIPVVFRDLHVQVIWEGTSSVMAHDVLRAVTRDDAGAALLDDLGRRISGIGDARLREAVTRVEEASAVLPRLIADASEGEARRLAWGLARTYQAALLCEAATRSPHRPTLTTAARTFSCLPLIGSEIEPEEAASLAFER